MNRLLLLFVFVFLLVLAPPTPADPTRSEFQLEVQNYLDDYTATYQRLYYASSLAEWESNTRIVPGDSTNALRTRAANEALAEFTGSRENIEKSRTFLASKDPLTPLQIRQLETILFMAADKPQTVPDLVRARIAADARENENLFGFTYRLEGKEVTTNDIDDLLKTETNLDRRRAVWEASKEIGPTLKPGLENLRNLRNQTVQALGYQDYFAYMASQYGLTTGEMAALIQGLNQELRPLYRELHTWARYELAARYHQPVPDLIPAHWLPNRWGQDWADLVIVEGLDITAALREKGAEWIVPQAESFYVSLGFPSLPPSFYEKSSLYPLPPHSDYKKNNHASAWHLDLDTDLRSLMSVEPTAEYYETVHHELGHVYYDMTYSTPEVPLLLREGADRAYHEAVGSLMGLAAMQPRFMASIGLSTGDVRPDSIRTLLREALNHVVFIPWSTGTMFEFERRLYAENMPSSEWNRRWWELAARYQGIAPPSPRDERYCDAATKTHIIDDAASYYDYALSTVLLFQLHHHIATKILKENPRNTNYFGRRDVGDFLKSLLAPGATIDGQVLLKEKTGSELSAAAMVSYFEPLMAWLKVQNAGRTYTLPEIDG